MVTRTKSRWQPYNPIGLIASTLTSPDMLSAPLPHPTHPGTYLAYPLHDVAQREPHQAASLTSKLNAHTT